MQDRIPPGRSCQACRRRKIRCDRKKPCSYCIKLSQDCVYGSRLSETTKPATDEVLAKLSEIETAIQGIKASIASSDAVGIKVGAASQQAQRGLPEVTRGQGGSLVESGKLLGQSGDSRYAVDGLWTQLEASVPDDTPTASIHTTTIESPVHSSSTFGTIFTPPLPPVSVTQLHPATHHIFTFWQVYIDSVDPLLKILHVPTTQQQVLNAVQNLTNIKPGDESLMFAVYFSAITCMQSSVSRQNRGADERQSLLERYRKGLEQSLANAEVMRKPTLTSLQAFTIYLTTARQSTDKDYVWTLTGLLIRLAMKIGLHRDPTELKMTPFESEMRRRLWWHVVILDIRTAEENDTEPYITDHVHDTKFPTSISDSELDINMTQLPRAQPRRTEVHFSLTRFEISYAARHWVFSDRISKINGRGPLSMQQKYDEIDALYKRLDAQYFRDYDDEIPICFLTRTAAKMVLAKIKLTIDRPVVREIGILLPEQLHQVVSTADEIIRYAHSLRTDPKYSQWTWLFQKYIEWDAVALLLHISRKTGFTYQDEVQDTIDTFFDDWAPLVVEGDRRWRVLQILRAATNPVHAVGNMRGPDAWNVVDTDQQAFGEPRAPPPIDIHAMFDFVPENGVPPDEMLDAMDLWTTQHFWTF